MEATEKMRSNETPVYDDNVFIFMVDLPKPLHCYLRVYGWNINKFLFCIS